MNEDVKEKEEVKEEIETKNQEQVETTTQEQKEESTPVAESASAAETGTEAPGGSTGKEEENELLVKFTVEVKDEEIQKKFDETVNTYASQVKLPGFRQGKVPVEVVKSRFKEAITEEVLNKAIEEAVMGKIKKDKLKVSSSPMVDKIDYEDGKDATAEITVELLPEIKLPDLETIEAEVPIEEFFNKEFNEQEAIDSFLESNKRRTPVTNRTIEEKDNVKLIYQAKLLDTKRMSPKKEIEYFVDKEKEDQFEIPGLASEIIGKRIMDKLTITRKLPADYKKKIWAGKEIEFHVEIDGIFEMVKPELDEAFLQSVGIPDIDTLKKNLKENYENQIKHYRDERDMGAIIEKLIEVINFPVPQNMVRDELFARLESSGITVKDEQQLQAFMLTYGPHAEKAVKSSLLFNAIKEEFKLKVTNEDMEKEFAELAERSKVPVKEVRKYFMNSKKDYESAKYRLERTKLFDLLKSKIKVKEVEKPKAEQEEKEDEQKNEKVKDKE